MLEETHARVETCRLRPAHLCMFLCLAITSVEFQRSLVNDFGSKTRQAILNQPVKGLEGATFPVFMFYFVFVLDK